MGGLLKTNLKGQSWLPCWIPERTLAFVERYEQSQQRVVVACNHCSLSLSLCRNSRTLLNKVIRSNEYNHNVEACFLAGFLRKAYGLRYLCAKPKAAPQRENVGGVTGCLDLKNLPPGFDPTHPSAYILLPVYTSIIVQPHMLLCFPFI